MHTLRLTSQPHSYVCVGITRRVCASQINSILLVPESFFVSCCPPQAAAALGICGRNSTHTYMQICTFRGINVILKCIF